MSDLVTRILDSVPAGTYGMHALFRLVDVRESEDVPTAAVQGGDQPRLLVNPGFAARYAATPERLLMLVMHELHHVILGHTRLLRVTTQLDNIVFDAVINALLCQTFPDPRGIALFTDFYDARSVPGALLRPAPGWRLGAPAPLSRGLVAAGHTALARVHQALYSPAGAAYEEIEQALRAACSPGAASRVTLLGDHGDDGLHHGDLERRAPGLLGAVREIVEAWPQPPDPIAGRSLSSELRSAFAPPRPVASNRRRLRELLAWAGGAERGGIHRQRGLIAQPSTSPLPSRSRRDVVLGLLGSPVLLHEGTVEHQGTVRRGERVHVYLDVSGSVSGILPVLTGAVNDCAGMVHPIVHAFSTEIADVTLRDLRRGEVRTTGGTDIACVAAHARRHGIRRAVLVTDGMVGRPSGVDRTTLEGIRLGVAWTPPYGAGDLAGLVGRSEILEVAA